ncbi:MAG: HpaII family restriction endonuclease [Bacteroidales bacterium]
MKGNKGDWSEIYVFLKLLADGRLNAADADLNAITEIYYPLIKILRQEADKRHEYICNDTIKVVNGDTKEILLELPVSVFVEKSQLLFKNLKASSGLSIQFPEIEKFLNSIRVNTLSAASLDKSDIKIVVHDFNTGTNPTFGFSIKSMIGSDSTLFNPAAGTNFIFKLIKPEGFEFDLKKFNTETLRLTEGTKRSKITLRLIEIEKFGFKCEFVKIQSENLQLNLQLIDSQLPEIISYLIYYKFYTGKSKVTDLLYMLNEQNPLKFNLASGHPFYEYKLKNFLSEVALGMTPEAVFTGKYDATGGIIIVKEDGDIVCYHIYNKNEFQIYLINNTKLDQPSTSEDNQNPGFEKIGKSKPYKYGWVYEQKGELFIKLNLQIRFT